MAPMGGRRCLQSHSCGLPTEKPFSVRDTRGPGREEGREGGEE